MSLDRFALKILRRIKKIKQLQHLILKINTHTTTKKGKDKRSFDIKSV